MQHQSRYHLAVFIRYRPRKRHGWHVYPISQHFSYLGLFAAVKYAAGDVRYIHIVAARPFCSRFLVDEHASSKALVRKLKYDHGIILSCDCQEFLFSHGTLGAVYVAFRHSCAYLLGFALEFVAFFGFVLVLKHGAYGKAEENQQPQRHRKVCSQHS